MRIPTREAVLAVGCMLLLTHTAQSESPPIDTSVPLTPATQRIDEAVWNWEGRDDGGREQVLRAAICEGLLSADIDSRVSVMFYVRENLRWLDLSKYEDCLAESRRLYGGDEGQDNLRLDESQLTHSPTEAVEQLCAKAIEEGAVTLWRGTPLRRSACMALAAAGGYGSLRSLVEEHYGQLHEREKRLYPLAMLMAMFDLTTGDGAGEQARTTGIKRLAAMDSTQLYHELQSDDAFAAAAVRICNSVCTKGQDQRCDLSVAVYGSLESQHRRITLEDGTAPLDPATTPTWLDQIGAAAQKRREYLVQSEIGRRRGEGTREGGPQ